MCSTGINSGFEAGELAGLLGLCAELIFEVEGHLELHDAFFLSQTCKSLRRLLSRDWKEEFLRLSCNSRYKFRLGIVHVSPYLLVCPMTDKIHCVDTADTAASILTENGHPTCFCDIEYANMVPRYNRYSPHYHQIVAALKLWRLGQQHSPLFKALLLPFQMNMDSKHLLYRSYFVAKPEIVDGRFTILEETTVFGMESISLHSLTHCGLQLHVCEHLNVGSWKLELLQAEEQEETPNELVTAVKKAAEHMYRPERIACSSCATECDVTLFVDRAVFRTRRDLKGEDTVLGKWRMEAQAIRHKLLRIGIPPTYPEMPTFRRDDHCLNPTCTICTAQTSDIPWFQLVGAWLSASSSADLDRLDVY